MNTFGLDKKYEQFDFEEITVEDLEVISGGSGGSRGTSFTDPFPNTPYPDLGPINPAPIINAISHAWNSVV